MTARVRRPFWCLFAIALAPLAFARCANDDRNCTYLAIVAGPVEQTLVLAYPEDGATSVPDDFGTILYYGADANLALRLASGANRIATAPGVVPSPLPSPIASADPGETLLSARAVPALQPHTTYAIRYTSSYTSGCPMRTSTQNITLGTFTTQ